MRERAMLIGADLSITGAPGRGTTIELSIPERSTTT
jgi:signal transduction histidine kinase